MFDVDPVVAAIFGLVTLALASVFVFLRPQKRTVDSVHKKPRPKKEAKSAEAHPPTPSPAPVPAPAPVPVVPSAPVGATSKKVSFSKKPKSAVVFKRTDEPSKVSAAAAIGKPSALPTEQPAKQAAAAHGKAAAAASKASASGANASSSSKVAASVAVPAVSQPAPEAADDGDDNLAGLLSMRTDALKAQLAVERQEELALQESQQQVGGQHAWAQVVKRSDAELVDNNRKNRAAELERQLKVSARQLELCQEQVRDLKTELSRATRAKANLENELGAKVARLEKLLLQAKAAGFSVTLPESGGASSLGLHNYAAKKAAQQQPQPHPPSSSAADAASSSANNGTNGVKQPAAAKPKRDQQRTARRQPTPTPDAPTDATAGNVPRSESGSESSSSPAPGPASHSSPDAKPQRVKQANGSRRQLQQASTNAPADVAVGPAAAQATD
eukprot:TRINITY_DN5347_c0_g1_i2.p1 TRINITY_DN5347_c0_g1~~TRINITY_DN5347_c0_g1_i2.p1  ORF type:complete len:444 (+),score=163.40 TRINITY_DN5347_c0_g1_i2:51-1382(+)